MRGRYLLLEPRACAEAALGRAYMKLERFVDAIAPLERAVATLEANGGEPQKLAEFRTDLSEARAAVSRRASSSRD